MAAVGGTQLAEILGELVWKEHAGERLLERASRSLKDPREVAYLWNLATEWRDHARILSRHRRGLDRGVDEVPYPFWPRGQGPTPKEALEEAYATTRDIAGDYRSCVPLVEEPYLRKFLSILAEEHDRGAIQLETLANGLRLFD
jgi:hypothetical protein